MQKKLGVDVENLIVSQPDTGEQGLEITEALVRSGVGSYRGSRFSCCISTKS